MSDVCLGILIQSSFHTFITVIQSHLCFYGFAYPGSLLLTEVWNLLFTVTEFSKKTGDYPSLSATDIQVLALTYQLEAEFVGVSHLKQEPEKVNKDC